MFCFSKVNFFSYVWRLLLFGFCIYQKLDHSTSFIVHYVGSIHYIYTHFTLHKVLLLHEWMCICLCNLCIQYILITSPPHSNINFSLSRWSVAQVISLFWKCDWKKYAWNICGLLESFVNLIKYIGYEIHDPCFHDYNSVNCLMV